MNNNIIDILNGLLLARYSMGKKQISLTKLLLLVNNNYRLEMTEESLKDILLQSNIVGDIVKDKIILQPKAETEEMENIDDDIHEKAVSQAGKEMRQESIEIKLKKKLDETLENYHLLKGIQDTNETLVVENVIKKDGIIYYHCKLKHTNIYVDIPKTIF